MIYIVDYIAYFGNFMIILPENTLFMAMKIFQHRDKHE